MSRRKTFKGNKNSRVAGGFFQFPWDVMDSPAYQGLNHSARSLLMELARQYRGDNNGRLLATEDYLGQRGWKTPSTIYNGLRRLTEAGLIHQTVQGGFPNRASWYALTFYSLDKLAGYDVGAVEGFEKRAYRENAALTTKSEVEGHPIATKSEV
jgi:hypothetical protein